MNKKRIFAISVSSVVLFGVIPLTVFAYLRSTPSKKENKIDIQSVQETVTETFTEPETQKTGENIFTKEVYVENTGSAPCFVRVYMDFSDSTIKAKSMLSADGENFYNWDNFLKNLDSKWEFIPTDDTATSDDTLEGWFYYTEVLPTKEKNVTSALLKALKTDYDNYYDISDFQLIVYSETVQAVDENGQLIQDETENNTAVPAWKVAWRNFLIR